MKNKKLYFLFSLLTIGSLFLSACGSLLNAAEQAVQGGVYGPQYTVQEHQTRAFESLWKDLKDSYIYYDTAGVDWTAMHDKYKAKIDGGLTDKQFGDLMHKLANELPTGALSYQSRSERIEVDTADFSTFEGIGAYISFQKEAVPHAVILDVIAGSPAEQAGLKPHDSIYSIDGNPVLLDEGTNVVNRIRGPAGSTVTLSVKTPGKAERSIEVTRGKLVNSGKLAVEKLQGTDYGYVLFPPLSYQAITQDFTSKLQDISSSQGLKGLVLDLRIAGSANGFPLQDLLTFFYNGSIGEFYNRAKQTQALSVTGQDQQGSQTIPLVVLIGANTSGSPEIFAAGMQATQRAVLIGQSTPGQVQSTDAFLLPDGSRIFVEAASFRLPNGTDIGLKGVQPDISVAAGWDEIQPDADPVLDKAIETLDGKK